MQHTHNIDKRYFLIFNILTMEKGPDFVARLEVVVGRVIGRIVCQSIMRNQLSRLSKDSPDLTADDCKTLTRNILTAVSLFITKEEQKRLKDEMDKLYETCFP